MKNYWAREPLKIDNLDITGEILWYQIYRR